MRELKDTFNQPAVGGLALFFRSTREEAGAILARLAERPGGASARRLFDGLAAAATRYAAEQHRCLLAVHFRAWACGPVQPDLLADLAFGSPVIMRGYLRAEGTRYLPVRKADLAVLGAYRAMFVERFAKETEDLSDEELHAEVTGAESPWMKAVVRGHYLDAFRAGILAVTEEEVFFEDTIDDAEGRRAYDESWTDLEEAGMIFPVDE